MFEAKIRREIQTELRQFDGNFRLQTSFSDALQNLEIVFGNLLGLGTILDVFAQVCKNRSNLLASQSLCRSKRVIQRLAGHEPGYRAPYKRVMRCPLAQPLILRCCEQHRSHQTHECLASLPSNASACGYRPVTHSKPHCNASRFSIFRRTQSDPASAAAKAKLRADRALPSQLPRWNGGPQ